MAGKAGFVAGSLAMDDLIAAEAGVPFRALCMPSFMDNLLRQAGPIKDQGVFYGPCQARPEGADGGHPGHRRDRRATAAGPLMDRDARRYRYPAPRISAEQDMAAIMSEVLGQPVRYGRTPAEEYKNNFLRFGFSEPIAQGMLDMAMAKDEGLDNGITRTPEFSTPTTFRQWCIDVLKPAIDA